MSFNVEIKNKNGIIPIKTDVYNLKSSKLIATDDKVKLRDDIKKIWKLFIFKNLKKIKKFEIKINDIKIYWGFSKKLKKDLVKKNTIKLYIST